MVNVDFVVVELTPFPSHLLWDTVVEEAVNLLNENPLLVGGTSFLMELQLATDLQLSAGDSQLADHRVHHMSLLKEVRSTVAVRYTWT